MPGRSSSDLLASVGRPPDLPAITLKLVTLKSQREIQAAIAGGRRSTLSRYVVYALGREGAPRLAIQVSKRIGKAVRRNRIRRLVKEVCRLLFPRFEQGADLVVIARPSAAGTDFQETRRVLERYFGESGFFEQAPETKEKQS